MGNIMGAIGCRRRYMASTHDIEHLDAIQFAIHNLEVQRAMKMKELEELHCCGICFQNPRTIAYGPCGHTVCSECGYLDSIIDCPFCRTNIDFKLKLYL